MVEYIERKDTCGDCIHVEVCEKIPFLTEFSRENPAYCKDFKNAADVVPRAVLEQVIWERNVAFEQLRDDYGVGLGQKKPADVVEVVRCKDCKYCGFCGEATNLEVMGFYGFCSRGERRNDAE